MRLEEMLGEWDGVPGFLKARIDTFRSFRTRQRSEKVKDIIVWLDRNKKAYVSRKSFDARADAVFYTLFGDYEKSGFLADYDDLLENFFTTNPNCKLAFNTRLQRLELAGPAGDKDRPGLEVLNEFVSKCISQFGINQGLFDTESASDRLAGRRIYILLKNLDGSDSRARQVLQDLGVGRSDEFNKFYRQAMRFWHPDVWRAVRLDMDQMQIVTKIAQELNFLKEFLGFS